MKQLIILSCLFFISLEAFSSNLVEFSSIKELPSGEVRITFKLSKVALVKSYALDEPSRIVIDIKDSELKGELENRQNYPIKKIRASKDGSTSRIVLDLYESVYWKKPWQIEKKDHVLLIFEITCLSFIDKFDKFISTKTGLKPLLTTATISDIQVSEGTITSPPSPYNILTANKVK